MPSGFCLRCGKLHTHYDWVRVCTIAGKRQQVFWIGNRSDRRETGIWVTNAQFNKRSVDWWGANWRKVKGNFLVARAMARRRKP